MALRMFDIDQALIEDKVRQAHHTIKVVEKEDRAHRLLMERIMGDRKSVRYRRQVKQTHTLVKVHDQKQIQPYKDSTLDSFNTENTQKLLSLAPKRRGLKSIKLK